MCKAYILGAGASRFAQYPLARDVWCFVKENYSRNQQIRWAEVEQLILQTAEERNLSVQDLEAVLSVLDFEDLLRHKRGTAQSAWFCYRWDFVSALRSAFLNHQNKIKQHRDLDASVVAKWVARLTLSDIVLTFNWDILHESLLFESKNWSPWDGYGIDFTNGQNVSEPSSSIPILKLHGSANWLEDARSHTVFLDAAAHFFPNTITGFSARPTPAQEPDHRGLVIPTYLKDFSDKPCLVKLWAKALDYLLSADEIIVIGYSLNPADQAARQLIAAGILNNKKKPPLTLVGCARNHWDKFCSSLGIAPSMVNGTFEQWVTCGKVKPGTEFKPDCSSW